MGIVGAGALRYGARLGALLLAAGICLAVAACTILVLRNRLPRLFKLATRTFVVAACTLLALGITASAMMLSCYFDEAAPDDAVMIVLGCGLSSRDHTSPSLILYKRLSAAEAYLKEHENTVCILSGGQGPDEKISEALAMHNFLVARGIDESRLYMEDESTSTRENLAFTRALMEREGLVAPGAAANVIVVTDGFHQFRAQRIAAKSGLDAYTLSSHAPAELVCIYWARELLAIGADVIRG